MWDEKRSGEDIVRRRFICGLAPFWFSLVEIDSEGGSFPPSFYCSSKRASIGIYSDCLVVGCMFVTYIPTHSIIYDTQFLFI